MTAFQIILMGLLIICAVSVSFSKNLLNSILIYMSFSLVMSMLWISRKLLSAQASPASSFS